MKHFWKDKNYCLTALIFIVLILGINVQFSSAAEKEILSQMEVKNDFVLSGGKIEVEMSPGDEVSKEIVITSRLGREMKFHVGVEDFVGSNSPDEPAAVLLGDQKGPYSLKDYIHPELTEFNLVHGERISIPFTIKLPTDAEPGGRYGSIVVWSTNPDNGSGDNEKDSEGQVKVISRLASLIFVRTKGDIKEEGMLKSFSGDRKFYEKGPVNFNLSFQNRGSVHVNPYGIIEIYNMLGRKVGSIEVAPFYALPDAVRWQKFSWERSPLVGLYEAKISLNRGYQNIVDEKEISFWVIPWKILSGVVIGLVILVWLIIRLLSRYEFRKKN